MAVKPYCVMTKLQDILVLSLLPKEYSPIQHIPTIPFLCY